MTNEDREFADFMLKFQNKTRELKEDFDKLSENNKKKFNKLAKENAALNFGNIVNFIRNLYIW